MKWEADHLLTDVMYTIPLARGYGSKGDSVGRNTGLPLWPPPGEKAALGRFLCCSMPRTR